MLTLSEQLQTDLSGEEVSVETTKAPLEVVVVGTGALGSFSIS